MDLFDLLVSSPNFEFHILQAGDKRSRGLLYPSLNKIQDRSYSRSYSRYRDIYGEEHSLEPGKMKMNASLYH